MLILTRRNNEAIHIGDDIIVHVLESRTGKSRIGIEAPDDVRVLRDELIETPESSPVPKPTRTWKPSD